MKDLNQTEEMCLLAVWKLGDNAYGVTIRRHLSDLTKRLFPYGTLYGALDKLARRGYLRKTSSLPVPERGGRRKFFYRITPEGIVVLKQTLELKKRLWDAETELELMRIRST